MKKIASLLVLAAVLGFSNASWAANRPNTPECTDVNGTFNSDACLIQYIEPLKIETVEMWSRLLKLQGKSAEENPWTFKVNSPACDPDSQSYDKVFCLLQTPGKLALEKYRIREEVLKLEIEQKLKRQKTKPVVAQATIGKLIEENIRLTEKLTEAEKKNEKLSVKITVFTGQLEVSKKEAEYQKKRAEGFQIWSMVFLIIMILLGVLVVVVIFRFSFLQNRAEQRF